MKCIECCKTCDKRYPACWGSCEKYLKEKEQYEKYKITINKRDSVDRMIREIRKNKKR